MNKIQNIQNEVLFVGSFYKNPDLYIEYGRFVVSQYDLSDEVTRFLYDNFEIYYKTFSQTIDEIKINTFMSQDQERLKYYKMYGGYKTIKQWMDIVDLDDFKNYMDVVKKYSLLREFNSKGFDVEKIMNHNKFNTMKAEDIVRLLRGAINKVSTVIMSNNDSVVATQNVSDYIFSLLDSPAMGIQTPFPQFDEYFRGFLKGKTYANAMLSNAGKSRLMILMASYIALVQNEKVLILANEMGEDDFRACMLVTIINNPYFKELHGVDIEKNEKEILLGYYYDNNKTLITRYEDDFGNYTETLEEYKTRLYNTSEEYRKVLQVADWIESHSDNIFFKQLFNYSDDVLESEIRKHKMIHSTDYVFYDTLKGYNTEEWYAIKQTATKLSTLAIELNVFMWLSLQMTDSTFFTEVFGLSSNNVASCKAIKHILDVLLLTVHLKHEDYYKYKIETIKTNEWGEGSIIDLNPNKRYVASVIDKNRMNSKDKIPVYEIDLNKNTWISVGNLIKCK